MESEEILGIEAKLQLSSKQQGLDDLEGANKMMHHFEQRYRISSPDFYELYQQGLLGDGEHMEDFALWAGFYQIKLDRMAISQDVAEPN